MYMQPLLVTAAEWKNVGRGKTLKRFKKDVL
jgi:hypothetical protein